MIFFGQNTHVALGLATATRELGDLAQWVVPILGLHVILEDTTSRSIISLPANASL